MSLNRFIRHIFLFAFLLFFTVKVNAQLPDTIVVYEYVYLTDTVWIEPEYKRDTIILNEIESIENAVLTIDTSSFNAYLKIHYNNNSATIPINHILLSEDNHQTLRDMKKITFLGLTFLALNSALYAQPEFRNKLGFFVKANNQYQKVFYYEMEQYDHNNSMIYSGGISFQPSFGLLTDIALSTNFSFTPKLVYNKKRALSKEYAYRSVGTEKDYSIQSYKGTRTTKFHFIATDLLLNFNFQSIGMKNLRIFAGPRIEYLVYNELDKNNMNVNYADLKKLNAEYLAGFGVDFLKRFSLELEFAQSINKFIDSEELWVEYTTFSMSLGVYLF